APAAPPATSPASGAPSAANLPNWLHDSESEAAPTGSEQLPDWLRDIAGDTSSSAASPSGGEPPSWQPAQPEPAGTGADIPDWLLDQANEPGAPPANPPALDDLFAESNEPAGAPPSWFGAANDEAPAPAQPMQSPSEP